MTAPSNANTSGLAVVAWRWETPIPHVGDGTKWGWSFASHWSTPPSSLNAEPLVTAASAQARIAELEAEIAEMIAERSRRSVAWQRSEARADRLAEIASKLSAAISWLDYPFIDSRTPEAELRQRVGFMMKDAEPHRAALQQETQK